MPSNMYLWGKVNMLKMNVEIVQLRLLAAGRDILDEARGEGLTKSEGQNPETLRAQS